MDTKISVIVPAFNIENDIERCAKSVLAQTYRNIELVIVDDGSTDNTATVIDRLANENAAIKVYHKPNGGVTSARLYGVQHASGEWIGFVDGDDEIEVDMYERLLRNAIKYAADISHCGYQMIFPDGHIDYYYNTGLLAQQDKITALKELLSGSRIEPGLCNKLFHMSLFHSLLHNDAVPTDIRINEDLLMNFRLFSAAEQTVYEDFCPYHYILRKGSAATEKKAHHLTDPIKVRSIIRDDLRNNEDLYPTALSSYIYSLISAATQNKWKDIAKSSKNRLKSELASGELSGRLSHKLCLMAFGVSYMRPLYRTVRYCYDRVTGVSEKYNI